MNVWLVTYHGYEDHGVEGVFLSETEAREQKARCEAQEARKLNPRIRDTYSFKIESREVISDDALNGQRELRRLVEIDNAMVERALADGLREYDHTSQCSLCIRAALEAALRGE
jgi:hypothetical protein